MKPSSLLALTVITLIGCNSGYTLTGNISDLEQPTPSHGRNGFFGPDGCAVT